MSAPQATVPELTVNVTEFKAKCLSLIDRVDRGELSRVTITRRGKVVGSLQPSQTPTAPTVETFDWEAWRADLARHPLGVPEDFDWIQPILDADSLEEWERSIETMFDRPAKRDDAA